MLSQNEADALITMRKTFLNPNDRISLLPGSDESYDLLGEDRHERFIFDVLRGTLRLSKVKYQTRGRKIFVLVRLDIGGAPHTNPDGNKIGGTHIHLYKEGFEDKWAYPLDPDFFPKPSDIDQSLKDFCLYCKIENLLPYQGSLT